MPKLKLGIIFKTPKLFEKFTIFNLFLERDLPRKSKNMKRDMDFIRDLLLRIDDGETHFQLIDQSCAEAIGLEIDTRITREECARFQYHIYLLNDAGFIDSFTYADGSVHVKAITWAGHDFLDSIRDDVIWLRTKEAAKAVGSFSIETLKGLAKGFLRKKTEELTGIKLDI